MSEGVEAPPARKRRWPQIVKAILGLALVAFVFTLVHWRDSITPIGSAEPLYGEICGEVPTRVQWDAGAKIEFHRHDVLYTAFWAAADLTKDKTGAPDVNEGLLRLVRRSDKTLLLVGLLLFGLVAQIGVTRWWLLLRAQDIHVPYAVAHRLTFLGFFFNNVVPGPTGGDVVKAVYIAKRTHKRAEAVVTVAVDRVVGIVALALIAASSLLFRLDDPKFRELAMFIGLFLAGVAAASMVFFSRRARRLLGVDYLIGKFHADGIIRQADDAIFRWRDHKKAVLVALLLSFANQLSIQCLTVFCFAAGLHVTTGTGDPVPFTTYMIVLPVAFIVSALPMLPGGWGVRELAFVVAFSKVGVERNPAIALSILNGMTQLAWSLLGGVYFLLDRGVAATPPAAGPEKATIGS